MMGHCKTCIYWEELTHHTELKFRLGECHQPKLRSPQLAYNIGIVMNEIERLKLPAHKDGLCVKDAEDYWAGLETAEDFGCINHAVKEQSTNPPPPPVRNLFHLM